MLSLMHFATLPILRIEEWGVPRVLFEVFWIGLQHVRLSLILIELTAFRKVGVYLMLPYSIVKLYQ